MRELKTAIAESYQNHPAFRFDKPSWDLPNSHFEKFNKRYEALRQIGGALKTSSFLELRRDCFNELDSVFALLQSQSSDEYEKQFLVELKSECVRLVAEELSWYSRPRVTRFVTLDGGDVWEDALRMETDRHFFGSLPASAVAELQDISSSELKKFRSNAAVGKLKRDDLSTNTGAVARAIRAVLNREFRKLGVLDVMSAYTGRKIRVRGVSLELSVPTATWWRNAIPCLARAPHTLYAHLDESISCPKSIVYLSNVTEQNGPTQCYLHGYERMLLNPLQEIIGRVVGIVGGNADSPLKNYYSKQYHQSANSENFRRHFMRLPAELRFNSHMGWDVMPDSLLEQEMLKCERKMVGPAGTFVAFDGARLLHRGGLMEQGERVALQVIFSDLTVAERAIGKIKRMVS